MAANELIKQNYTDIADAIRAKKGTTELISPRNFADEITNLPTGSDLDELMQETFQYG